jgi:hypothetical protein
MNQPSSSQNGCPLALWCTSKEAFPSSFQHSISTTNERLNQTRYSGPTRNPASIADPSSWKNFPGRRFHSLPPREQAQRARGAVRCRKDSRRDPLRRQSLNPGDTSMDNAVPQAAAIDSLLRSASPCKGLSGSNSAVVVVFLLPGKISSAPSPRGRIKPPIHLLQGFWERNGGRFART